MVLSSNVFRWKINKNVHLYHMISKSGYESCMCSTWTTHAIAISRITFWTQWLAENFILQIASMILFKFYYAQEHFPAGIYKTN